MVGLTARLKRFQVLHALVVSALLAAILWGFSLVWLQTNTTITDINALPVTVHYGLYTGDIESSPTAFTNDHFERFEFNEAPIQFGRIDRWYQLQFTNATRSDQPLVLVLDNPIANQISVYQLSSDNTLERAIDLGDKAQVKESLSFIIPHSNFIIPAEQSITLRIRFETDGAPFLPMVILTLEDFEKYQRHIHLIWGTFVGVILLMMAYNLVLYLGVNDRAYLLYIGYITSMLVLLGAVHGFGHYLFPTALQLWLGSKIITLNSIAAFFAVQFALYFLKYTRDEGAAFSLTHKMSGVILGFSAISLLIPEYIAAPLFAAVQLLSYALIVKLILGRLGRSFRWTKYYVVSWIPFFVGAAIGYLLFVGAVEYSFFTRHALMFAVIFEMAFISMALADRLGDTERQRLFLATHDEKLNLPNEVLLEEAISRQSNRSVNQGFTLLVIEILNYDSVIPYIPEKNLSPLINAMGREFVKSIQPSMSLIDIDLHGTDPHYFSIIHGELFGLLLATNNEVRVETLLKDLSRPDNHNPMQSTIPYRIPCVFGAAINSDVTQKPVELINQARRAINQAIQNTSGFQIYDQDQTRMLERKVRLAQDLGIAIAKDELELFHQPQLLITNPELRSSETLLRWQHPELGAISPAEFVEIAEETGLINHLTQWVLNKAFEHAQVLKSEFALDFNMSINISAKDLSRAEFVSDVERYLKIYNMAAEHFTLEVTETAHLKGAHVFKDSFLKLQRLGFKFSMDDFGTGYSSLMYANEHPFTELKIDRSFINDLLLSNKLMAIVSATVTMAKGLGLVIAAEGVEDQQTFDALKTMGCDKFQGYCISEPLPLKEFLTWRPNSITNTTKIGETLSIDFEQAPSKIN